jgi:hypothetical protein
VSKTESDVMGEAKLVAGMIPGLRLMRNNVGKLRSPEGRIVEFGLGVGTSDLIGFQAIEITPHMVGKTVAQFVAVECKKPGGRLTEDQANFLKLVESFGGKAIAIWDAGELKPKLAQQPGT